MTVSPEKTREALEASIEAWKAKLEIEDPHKVRLGFEACRLCALFYQGDRCNGCPVLKATRKHFCIGSPYVAAIIAWRDWAFKKGGTRQAFIKAAKKEISFLESLRETDHAKV